jgi:hypothetical protein
LLTGTVLQVGLRGFLTTVVFYRGATMRLVRNYARLRLRTCNVLRVSVRIPAIPRVRCLIRIPVLSSVLCVLSATFPISRDTLPAYVGGSDPPSHLGPREATVDNLGLSPTTPEKRLRSAQCENRAEPHFGTSVSTGGADKRSLAAATAGTRRSDASDSSEGVYSALRPWDKSP